ncbi:SEC-C domain-containing protein [Bacillus thuringiensis]|uniref:SEC-C domain-containing protein n=2 Tax=Bacillus thuringiensis TaxID=1428 RepID=UPI001C4FF3F5|nr:SEC-C domain-containing protein [Bacillus thuringiensis]
MELIKFYKFMKTEPCPCGSGKKYRACCMNKKDQELPFEKVPYKNREGAFKNYAYKLDKESKIKECLYPNSEQCEGKIKSAHSLQNNGVLSKISENGHVVILNTDYGKDDLIYDVKDVSKNKATTFTGFCDKHDTLVFKDIETKEIDVTSNKQCFLFAYRAFALELHKKKESLKSRQQLFKVRPTLSKEIEFIAQYRYAELALNDVSVYKKFFDKALINENYDMIQSTTFTFDYEVSMAACGGFTLTYDIKGNKMNDIHSMEDERLKTLFFTIIPNNGKTYFIFSWIKYDNAFFKDYIQQLEGLTEEQFKTYINNFLPSYTENLVVAPSLWSSFTKHQKDAFFKLFSADVETNDNRLKANLLRSTSYDLLVNHVREEKVAES